MEDQAETIVKQAVKAGAQDAVAEVVVDRSYQIRFAQNAPVIVNEWRRTVGSVFLVRNRRVVTGDITDFDKVPQILANLMKAAKASPENPDYRGIAEGPFQYRRATVDRKIVALGDGSDHVEAAVNGVPHAALPQLLERGLRGG
ncbi:MAG: hypothetical protein E6K18_08560 [Methanobacteriota archaeon]|nr:MAG: hypothetical protein E6K18_08560 [Euryarchaeota archaeon]